MQEKNLQGRWIYGRKRKLLNCNWTCLGAGHLQQDNVVSDCRAIPIRRHSHYNKFLVLWDTTVAVLLSVFRLAELSEYRCSWRVTVCPWKFHIQNLHKCGEITQAVSYYFSLGSNKAQADWESRLKTKSRASSTKLCNFYLLPQWSPHPHNNLVLFCLAMQNLIRSNLKVAWLQSIVLFSLAL